MDVERGGVEYQVRLLADLAQPLPFSGDPVHYPAVLLQRVRAAHVLETPYQRLVAGFEEHHARPDAAGAEFTDARLQVGGERPAAAQVDDRGDSRQGPVGPPRQVDHGW